MKRFFLIALILFAFAGCKKESGKDDGNVPPPIINPPGPDDIQITYQ